MNKRVLLIIALVAVIGIFAVMLLLRGGSSGDEVAIETDTTTTVSNYSEVVVVATDIPARTEITGSMIKIESRPTEYIHPMAITNIEDALEMISLVPISAGEEVLQTKVADPDTNFLSYKLEEGHVAFTVPVSDLSAAAGMVRVGDEVHVLGNFPEDVSGEEMSQFVLFDLKVLAIGQNMSINAMAGEEGLSNMTLEVTTEEATKLAYASNSGTLTYILKSVLDKEDADAYLESITSETFFGDKEAFQDAKYIQQLQKAIELRQSEAELDGMGMGDVERIRDEVEYERFNRSKYGNTNGSSTGTKGGTGTTNGSATNNAGK